MEENKISDLLSKTLDSIKGVADANTVTGTPIETSAGVTIVPVSKVSVGFAGGGTDFGGKHLPPEAKKNFGGGTGAGITTNPVGFLVVKPSGDVSFISVSQSASGGSMSVSDLGEAIKKIVEKVKEAVDKNKEKKAEEKKEEAVKAEEKKEDTEKPAEKETK